MTNVTRALRPALRAGASSLRDDNARRSRRWSSRFGALRCALAAVAGIAGHIRKLRIDELE